MKIYKRCVILYNNRYWLRWINTFVILLLLLFLFKDLEAQNINGEKVIVGKESITIINFPDKVLNINFSDEAAYEYYIPKRREEKSISIQFNKEKQDAPNTNLLVNEGGRSHMFRIIFDSTYNINDDTRPPLWYDHSNLKELKAFVQKQKDRVDNPVDEIQEKKEAQEQQRKQAEQRNQEYAAAQKQREEELAKRNSLLEKQRKEEEANQKEQALAIAKAKKESEEKEKQFQIAQAKEAQEKKAAEEQARKEAEAVAKQKSEQEKQMKLLQEKAQKDQKASEELAKAKKDSEEKQRLQEEKIALQKAKEEENRRIAAEAIAKKEEEKRIAKEKLEKLEAERKEQEANKAYSEAGLWQRYGKKGINLYDVPREHMGTVISDFYIAKDTLLHYHISDSLLNAQGGNNLNIEAGETINKGVKITLLQITFKDVYSYYKLRIENNSTEDFLMGKTYLYWYNAQEKPIKMIKSSYITSVIKFPFVRPGTSQDVVFVTRSPNVISGESLVLFIDERRKEKGSASIVIDGDIYIRELKKVQHDVKTTGSKISENPSKPEKNKKRNAKK